MIVGTATGTGHSSVIMVRSVATSNFGSMFLPLTKRQARKEDIAESLLARRRRMKKSWRYVDRRRTQVVWL
jgi:hypothetical protein